MAKLTLMVLALTAITVQADYRSEGSRHRIPRSPSPIESPPEPLFQTHQWSGFQKSSDGKQAGVFSGAAAAAEGGSQASEQAFSIATAASGDSGPVLGTGSQVKSGHSHHPYKLESRFGGDDEPASSSSSQAQYQSGYQGGENGGLRSGQFGGNQGQSGFQGRGFKESHYSYQRGDQDGFVKGGYSGGFGSGSQSQAQAQAQSSGGSGFIGGHANQQESERNTYVGKQSALGTKHEKQQLGYQNSGFDGSGYQGGNGGFTSANSGASASQGLDGAQNTGAVSNAGESTRSKAIGKGYVPSKGFNAEQKKINTESQGYNSGLQGANSGVRDYNSGLQSSNSGYPGYNAGLQGYYSGRRRGYNSAHDSYNTGQSALNGALNLASQGLQMSPPSSGCSTCEKSNYALSNARSKNGDAVAVSVGG